MSKARMILAVLAALNPINAINTLANFHIRKPVRDWVSSNERKTKAEKKRQRKAERNLRNKR